MENVSMFEKLAQGMQNLYIHQNVFNPARFDDPIALQTDWMRASAGGSNFRTFKLVQVNPYRLSLKPLPVLFYLRWYFLFWD
jgi:hypothetical protein